MAKDLEPDETVVASSPAQLQSPEGAPSQDVQVTITRSRVLAATSAGVTNFPFAQVVELAEREPSVRLSGVGFNVVLTFPKDGYSEAEQAIYLGCVRLSPTWEMLREGARRFLELDRRPVATWMGCPVCEVPLAERQTHVVHCMRCGRFYSDPGYQPLVGEPRDGGKRNLIGQEEWGPLMETQRQFKGHTLSWATPPPSMGAGPIYLPDSWLWDVAHGTI